MKTETKTILVTGMSGLIGGIAGRDLAKKYHVRALNRRTVKNFETIQADIRNFDSIKPAFNGIDTVVHMAAYLGDNPETQLAVNVEGTYNVFKAAKDSGVKRIIFGSSGAVQKAIEGQEPFLTMVQGRSKDMLSPPPQIGHLDSVNPSDLYGATKIFGEALSKMYSNTTHMSVLVIRLGRVTEENRPRNVRDASVYLSHRDASQMVMRCVEAKDDLPFGIFYAISNNFNRFRDIDYARKIIGYVPQDGIKSWPLPTS